MAQVGDQTAKTNVIVLPEQFFVTVQQGLNNCEHICTDFDGGFNCSCHPGFYLTDTDIDECQPGRHNCDQICKNTIGSFQCLCNEDINECKQDIKICDQICTDLTPGYNCSCNPGYYLDVHNGKTCKGIDNEKIFIHNYVFMITFYGKINVLRCYARTLLSGYVMSFTVCLLQSCVPFVECESGYFGINCSLACQCSKEKTYYCDRINGSCLCKHGWTGMTCETDINECQNNVCQNNTLCKNTNGSYECLKCDNGFVNETDGSTTLQTTEKLGHTSTDETIPTKHTIITG
ncbi:hypothetical protein KUTeg_015420 [Tegillarca granosa]|uniref:EGF-like domain-containing protein n=1 Tax=Tegillarca granosa TaxID=220873 RepID=A0ABQ9ESG8_TEGGR|nr:hypothetical protein KUTeg_015420 [Tegillarca granosa]